MGFIKAITDSVGGTFADQWKDFYVPQQNIAATAAVTRAVLQGTNNDRGQNTKGSENIISNGSKIMVPEGMALITMQDGAVTGFIAEPGGFIFSSEDINSQSFFGGNGILSSTIKQSWERFKFGGQPGSQQLAFYVNLKEIPNNKFGTQNEIYWDDAFFNTQVGALARGSYTLKITDPILFVKNFVPAKYLLSEGEDFDFADMNNDAGAQLFNEVVSSLQSAFSMYTNDPSRGNRMSKIQGDQIGFGQSLSGAVEQNYNWKSDRGLEIIKVAIQSIEYDADTKELMKNVKSADALMGARGNSFMQQSIAKGMENAGSSDAGAMGMAFMGMGTNAAGSVMNTVQQPVSAPAYNPVQNTVMQQQVPVNQTVATPVGVVPAATVVQATPVAPAAQEDPYAKLTELKKLLDAGVITEADFNAAKNNILGI